MNTLLAELQIKDFERILAAYKAAGISLGDIVDGGAGSGATSRMMLAHLAPDAICHSFEPFPGNHRFFASLDSRIRLIPKAMANSSRTAKFEVPSTVAEDSDWGRRGMAGYSSVGFLSDHAGASAIEVECVRADEEIADTSRIGVAKLDLQGGELGALQGMTGFLKQVQVMWVEFTGQPGLIDFLEANGFILFDTEYFFMADMPEGGMKDFEFTRTAKLSTGRTAWFGYKKGMWRNYETDFARFRQELKLVQTDLLCVNKAYLPNFTKAMGRL